MGKKPSGSADDLATVPGADGAGELVARYTLVVVQGPDSGRRFALDPMQPTRLLIGQGPACELRLSDRQISRRHSALEPHGTRFRLTDLGSSNGTFVDGVGIVEVYLRGGEMVRMGETVLRVERERSADALSLPPQMHFGRLVGGSEAMRRLYPLCERLAASVVPVVIEGETGTGKELLAEALHEMGPRAAGPFVVFDCTAVPPNLVESELFGHERGAFTGAIATRKGVFEQAHGGTLLIDEIGDLDPSLQPKLLRAMERFEIRRVGGDRPISVDVRVLAATRRDLDRLVQEERFRDDLFHRLAVARIELPPLRRRQGDIALLVRQFWAKMGGVEAALTDEALRHFEDWSWPGNVRELRNAVARRIALGELGPIAPAKSSLKGDAQSADAIEKILALDLPFMQARQKIVSEFESRFLERVLQRHGGNVSQAAAASGIARRSLQLIRARQTKG